MQSGYHGLDAVLWLVGACPKRAASDGIGKVSSVSARCLYEVDESGKFGAGGFCEEHPKADQVEVAASLRAQLACGAIFELACSFANPVGSVDESLTILGADGMIRYRRERPVKLDMSPGTLTYQHHRGSFAIYEVRHWTGLREAPLRDFLDAVDPQNNGQSRPVLSPASDSVEVLKVITAAYDSAKNGAKEICL
jgi:predicted dehydrogenase